MVTEPTVGLEPTPSLRSRCTKPLPSPLSHVGTITTSARAAGGRGAARRDTNGSRVLVRPAGTGTRPPAARSCCCTHTPTVVNERPPLPRKTLRPAWRIAQAGRLGHPSDGAGAFGRLRPPCPRKFVCLFRPSNARRGPPAGRG